MRQWISGAARAALALAVMSCTGTDLTAPDSKLSPDPSLRASLLAGGPPLVRFSELHYDNVLSDAGERLEISGPAGFDLAGWQVILYNGAGGAPYHTTTLTQTIPATCVSRGVVTITYPTDGIQNGAPDGMALVTPGGVVVEFLSYEGTFSAAGGPANGYVSTSIVVSEGSTTPVGHSLQRNPDGTWNVAAANSFGACNDFTDPLPPAEVASVTITPAGSTILASQSRQLVGAAYDAGNQLILDATLTWSSSDETVATVSATGVVTGVSGGDAQITATAPNDVSATVSIHVDVPPPPPVTRFSEIHYDNFGTDLNEAIEIEGPAGTSLTGWKIVLYNGSNGAAYNTETLVGNIPSMCDGRGVVFVTYAIDGVQNGTPDGFALVNSTGTVIEFLSYEGTMTATDGPAAGMTSTDIGVTEVSAPLGTTLRRNSFGLWQTGAANMGACNSGVGPLPPPPGNNVVIVGRTSGDPALPVGFQDQLFARLVDPANVTLATTFTWSSETPAIASIDADGVMTALAAGTAVFRATAADGSTRAYALATTVATFSGVAYPGNAEFGEPADANSADDFILRHRTFTTSYSSVRNTPNWVSYNLDPSHVGAQDRCDCFTFDPALPGSYTRYTTADYTGAGDFHGYGIDRGHLARSFDRTTGTLDNAFTFYFSNIIPQAADNNQGPWARFETYLLDTLAIIQNKEVYIVAGPAGNKGTIKDEGVIVIPEYTWKIAVMVPRDQGLASIDDAGDLEVIAVAMPNTAGIRNVPWRNYVVTVDSVESLSGYDVLSLLPDYIETALETGAQEAVELIAQMLTAGTIDAGQANSMQSKIQAAINSIIRGQGKAAVSQFRALSNQLESLVADGILTEAEAAPLAAVLASLIATVGS